MSAIELTPGPGAYSTRPKIGEAPKYAMRPKTALPVRENVPGPGQYTPIPNNIRKRPPSAVIGRQQRSADLTAVKGMPGPGAYVSECKSSRNAPAYSFGSARKISKTELVPGPGAYRVPCTFANLPKYSVMTSSQEFGFV